MHLLKHLNIKDGFLSLLLPWIIILLFTSSLITLMTFLSVIVGLIVLGRLLLETASTNLLQEDKIFLSLPAGYLVISGIIALTVRFGISPSVVFWTLAAFVVLALSPRFVRESFIQSWKVHGLGALAILSLIIAFIYFLPGAIRDAVYLPDGSYNWMYVDTQYFSAIAANVKTCIGAPKCPGVSFIDLSYHFGPYSVAGAISAALGIPIGDALVRIARPIALLSLILTTYTAGRFLGRTVAQEATGGILAVVGLFFYGSIGALFSSSPSSSLVTGAIVFDLPYLAVPSDGGPFAHLILGHSQVHGLSGLLLLIVVLLSKLQVRDWRCFRLDASTFGPAILFPTSVILGFAFLGLYILLLSWFGARQKRTWITLCIAVAAAIFSAWAMGYMNILGSGLVGFTHLPSIQEKMFALCVWIYIGLGIRLYAFSSVKNPFNDPVSAVLIISFSGLTAAGVFCGAMDARYGFLYAQGILGVFAFAFLSAPLHAAINKGWREVFSEINKVIRIVFISGAGFLIYSSISWWLSTHSTSASIDNQTAIIRLIKVSSIVVVFSVTSFIIMARPNYLRKSFAMVIVSVCIFGFTAWVTDWINYGLGRLNMDITISKEEVKGLEILRRVSEKGDLICTNKHMLTGYRSGMERSYAYGALSERPILIEGFFYSGLENMQLIQEVLKENDLLFDSSQPGVVKSIIEKYGIKYLVVRPGTALTIANELPDWLREIQVTGNLKIYAVINWNNSNDSAYTK
jgi:hypothetical protein